TTNLSVPQAIGRVELTTSIPSVSCSFPFIGDRVPCAQIEALPVESGASNQPRRVYVDVELRGIQFVFDFGTALIVKLRFYYTIGGPPPTDAVAIGKTDPTPDTALRSGQAAVILAVIPYRLASKPSGFVRLDLSANGNLIATRRFA